MKVLLETKDYCNKDYYSSEWGEKKTILKTKQCSVKLVACIPRAHVQSTKPICQTQVTSKIILAGSKKCRERRLMMTLSSFQAQTLSRPPPSGEDRRLLDSSIDNDPSLSLSLMRCKCLQSRNAAFQSCRNLLSHRPLDTSDDSRFQPTHRLTQAICFAFFTRLQKRLQSSFGMPSKICWLNL